MSSWVWCALCQGTIQCLLQGLWRTRSSSSSARRGDNLSCRPSCRQHFTPFVRSNGVKVMCGGWLVSLNFTTTWGSTRLWKFHKSGSRAFPKNCLTWWLELPPDEFYSFGPNKGMKQLENGIEPQYPSIFFTSLFNFHPEKLGSELLTMCYPYPTRINPVFYPYLPVFIFENPGFEKIPRVCPTRIEPVSNPYFTRITPYLNMGSGVAPTAMFWSWFCLANSTTFEKAAGFPAAFLIWIRFWVTKINGYQRDLQICPGASG